MLSLISSRFTAGVAALLAVSVLALASTASQAADGFGLRFLEDPTIAAVGNKGEIHLNFSSQVRYIRHFPSGKGTVLKISLDVVDPAWPRMS